MFECQNYNALRSFKRHAAFFYLNSFWSNPFLGLRRKAIEVKKIATPHPHAERTEIGFGVLSFITFAIIVCINKKHVSDKHSYLSFSSERNRNWLRGNMFIAKFLYMRSK